MNISRTSKLTVLVAAATVPVGIYAGIGSKDQPADAATRAKNNRGHLRDHQPFALPVNQIAKELGVSSSTLKKALEDLRTQAPKPSKPNRDVMLQELATKLGVSVSDLQNAFDKLRQERQPSDSPKTKPAHQGEAHSPRPPADLIEKLAKLLNLDSAKVQTAFQELQTERAREHEQRFTQFINDLATRLHVSADKVKAAFEKYAPHQGGPGRDHHPGGPPAPPGEGPQHPDDL